MDWHASGVHFARLLNRMLSKQMNRLTAVACVLAACVSSPLAAKSRSMPAAAPATDISGAASVAASYGSITSAYRSVAHNRAVGGVANSYHLSGRAIDVARKPGVTHGQIAAALQRAGYVMIESLDEGDHSHFAFATTRAVPDGSNIALAAARPVKPPPPAPPPLLADEHGTLLIDLGASGQQDAKTSIQPARSVASLPATAARD